MSGLTRADQLLSMFMSFAASAFSFSNIHTAYKQKVSRVWFLKALLRLFYDLFSCVLSYI